MALYIRYNRILSSSLSSTSSRSNSKIIRSSNHYYYCYSNNNSSPISIATTIAQSILLLSSSSKFIQQQSDTTELVIARRTFPSLLSSNSNRYCRLQYPALNRLKTQIRSYATGPFALFFKETFGGKGNLNDAAARWKAMTENDKNLWKQKASGVNQTSTTTTTTSNSNKTASSKTKKATTTTTTDTTKTASDPAADPTTTTTTTTTTTSNNEAPLPPKRRKSKATIEATAPMAIKSKVTGPKKLNGYTLFVKANCSESVAMADVAKLWRKLTDEEKLVWKEKASKL